MVTAGLSTYMGNKLTEHMVSERIALEQNQKLQTTRLMMLAHELYADKIYQRHGG